MSTKNAPSGGVPAPSDIPNAEAFELADPEELEGLTLGPPFAMTADCELVDRGGDDCPECGQPEVSGSVSIVRCECGQVFRINLLASGAKPCPNQCGRVFTHLLIVSTQDDDQVFGDAAVQVMRANGFTVRERDDDDEPEGDPDDDDEPEGDPDDDETPEPGGEQPE